MQNYEINIKPKINLLAPQSLWSKFKRVTPKQITLNDQILCLIQGYIEEREGCSDA